jgi:hypothetical protein
MPHVEQVRSRFKADDKFKLQAWQTDDSFPPSDIDFFRGRFFIDLESLDKAKLKSVKIEREREGGTY